MSSSIPKKFQDAGSPLMDGTECKGCYLKIAENKVQKAEAGVKVVVQAVPLPTDPPRLGVVVMLRLRAHRKAGAQVLEIGNGPNKLKHITDVWPGFPRDRASETRTAADLVTVLDRTGPDVAHVPDDLEAAGFYEKIAQAAYGAIPRQQIAAKREVLVDYVRQHVREFVDKWVAQFDMTEALASIEAQRAAMHARVDEQADAAIAKIKGKEMVAQEPSAWAAQPPLAELCEPKAVAAQIAMAVKIKDTPAAKFKPTLAVDNDKKVLH